MESDRCGQTSHLYGQLEKTKGRLSFGLPKPWIVSDQIGRTLAVIEGRVDYPECVNEVNGEQGDVIIEGVLRDPKGRLVLLAARQAPTLPDGRVVLAPYPTPEIESVRWLDLGCPGYEFRGAYGVTYRNRAVAIELHTAEGEIVVAGPGERKPLTLGGRRYIFAVSTAKANSDGGCSAAAWSVYESCFFTQGPAQDAP